MNCRVMRYPGNPTTERVSSMEFTIPSRLKVAVYAQENRQGEEQLDSLHSQLQMLKEEGKRWGSITRVFVDTCPVSRRDRPGLKKLLADAAKLKFDAVLVTDMWRLFGNVDIGYEIVEILSAAHRHLISQSIGSCGENHGCGFAAC